MALRRSVIAKFIEEYLAPRIPSFTSFDKTFLLRVRRPLLHGICLEQSPSDDAVYMSCFIQFLTGDEEHIAFTMGERGRRHDRKGATWRLDPAESEAADLLAALQEHPLSPFCLDATCANLLRLADPERLNTHALYGLGTCAVYESDPALAHWYFEKVRELTATPASGWRLELLNRTETIDGLLGDLAEAKSTLMTWVESSIRRLRLENIA